MGNRHSPKLVSPGGAGNPGNIKVTANQDLMAERLTYCTASDAAQEMRGTSN